ncbi:MAG: FAD-binding oxidoreductase [Rhodopila sp.]
MNDLSGIPFITDPDLVRQKSRDFFWFSPILDRQLHHCTAQVIACPRSEDDVIRLAAACVRHKVPITPRGGGTGNYGQSVPLEGGVVLDMTGLDTIEWQRPGMLRVGPGRTMIDIDAKIRPSGWELRMHPSTRRSATMGGFIAGGSGGIGSVTWGRLREPGNVAAARIVTMEDVPRVIELRDAEVQAVNHAYGTTGLITALEMPLAPAWDWVELVIAFPTLIQAMRFGYAAALADGIVKKLLSPIAWPIPVSFRTIRDRCPDDHAILIAMIAEPSLVAFKTLLHRRHASGTITFEQPASEAPDQVPLYEFTWNHTTLQMLKRTRGVTWLQTLHPVERLLDSVADMEMLFGDELTPHMEFLRINGQVTAIGLPIVRYTTDDRLYAIMAELRARGISIVDPHVFTLEDGSGGRQVEAPHLRSKREFDPHGLLNPGKMRSFQAHALVQAGASPEVPRAGLNDLTWTTPLPHDKSADTD